MTVSPYQLVQLTPQETKVLVWSLKRTLAGLDTSVIADLDRLAKAKTQIEELIEYLNGIQTSYDQHPPARATRV